MLQLFPPNQHALRQIGHGRNTQHATLCGDAPYFWTAVYVDLFNAERSINFDGVRTPLHYRQVVIAGEQHYRNALFGETANTLGKLTLLGLTRVTRLVGIAGKNCDVYVL